MKASKETLIRTAETIFGRMPEDVDDIIDDKYGCSGIECKNCPCSWQNNSNDTGCRKTDRSNKTWLKNWLEENKPKDVIMNKTLKLHKIEGDLKLIREDMNKAEIRAFECRGREDNMTLLASYGKNGFEYFNAPHTHDDMKKIVEWAGNLLQEVEA